MRELFVKWRQFIEETIPSIAFVILFVSFIIQIVARYIFNNPVTWAYEVTTFMFIWIIYLGAIYTKRENKNIAFTALYDTWSDGTKKKSDLINHVLIAIFYPVVLYYTVAHLMFISYERSPVLDVPLSIVFSAFAFYLVGSTYYSVMSIWDYFKGEAS